MALDPALEAAIREAAEEEGQPATVAARLIAWAEALAEGDDAVERQESFYARLMSAVSGAETADED
ncbi:CxC ATPase DNA modification system associated small protein [Sphingosinicella terrae]|uniref:CxC ATPase DNA modification system associated small protein n=1 Tax=Sphingosinicella terrae TaxID=2172047 RepID=UPI000E0D62DF|nr:CxC ATPase DNA modification system associated small protein [Sphingosinicella terrae]